MKNIMKNLKNNVPLWHLPQVVQLDITIKKSCLSIIYIDNGIEF